MLAKEVLEKCDKAFSEIQGIGLLAILGIADIIRQCGIFYGEGRYRTLESIVKDIGEIRNSIDKLK